MGLGLGCTPNQLASVGDGARRHVDYFEPILDEISVDHETSHGLPMVLHGCALSPAGSDAIPPDLIRRHRRVCDRFGSPWVCEDLGTWRLDGQRPTTGGWWPGILDEGHLDLLCDRLAPLERCLGRPFALEFSPGEVVVGNMSATEFVRELVRRTGCALVLDTMHLLHHARFLGSAPAAILDELPRDHVIELHVSGGRRSDGAPAYTPDTAADLFPDAVQVLQRAARRAPCLKAVTLECHGAPAAVIERSLATLAELPEVQQLRASLVRRPPSRAVEDPSVADLARLGRAGASQLRPAELAVRALLESPRSLAEYEAGTLALAPGVRELLAAVDLDAWTNASDRHLERQNAHTKIARLVMRRLHGSVGAAIRHCWRHCVDPEGTESSPLRLVECLADAESTPPWARDVLLFDLDTRRVARGMGPRSFHRRNADGFEVTYGRSVVRTINAVDGGNPPPPAEPTVVSMRRRDGRLRVREL
jgi:hypothetical protein